MDFPIHHFSATASDESAMSGKHPLRMTELLTYTRGRPQVAACFCQKKKLKLINIQYMYIYIYIYMYMCICNYMHVYVYTYTYIDMKHDVEY